VASLRAAGRVVLAVEGEGDVVLDGGLWVGSGPESSGGERDESGRGDGDRGDGGRNDSDGGLDQERAIVAQWLAAHAGMVRILEVESPSGMVSPACRIPALAELTGQCAAGVSGR